MKLYEIVLSENKYIEIYIINLWIKRNYMNQ